MFQYVKDVALEEGSLMMQKSKWQGSCIRRGKFDDDEDDDDDDDDDEKRQIWKDECIMKRNFC